MGLEPKSRSAKGKVVNNKPMGGLKKRNTKNKAKKNETKQAEKYEAKQTKFSNQLTLFNYVIIGGIIFCVRLLCAVFGIISDCDETYNYWEPTHFLMYGKGFQTWEYSPQYALRSYFYLLLHVTPAWLNAFIFGERKFAFYFIKIFLAGFCAFCETYFISAVYKEFGRPVAKLVMIFLLVSPGMYIASHAFLPSSFSMYMCFLSTAAWMTKKYELAILAVAISTLIGWPFAALLGVPLAFEMLFIKNYYKKFIQWSLLSCAIILPPLIKMDSDLYGRLVVAPLNIITYNVFTSHGPNLYGEEPIFFYTINGILNFNIVFFTAVFAPLILYTRNFVTARSKKRDFFPADKWFLITPFYLWYIVFTLQPHKEERFLFPVYPLICLCGATYFQSVHVILTSGFLVTFDKAARQLADSNLITKGAVTITVLLGLSRIFALYKGYHAPMDVWNELKYKYDSREIDSNVPINVCIGKEWHRFPSTFMLPNLNWNVKFIESDFKGQLPAEYSPLENSTTIVHSYFNDLNKEERSRYWNVDKCQFLIDCDYGKISKLEPNYTAQTDKWTLIRSFPFLNAEKSPRFLRSFYIPFISEKLSTYASYNLLQSTSFG